MSHFGPRKGGLLSWSDRRHSLLVPFPSDGSCCRVDEVMGSSAQGGLGFQLVIHMPAVGLQSDDDSVPRQVEIRLFGIPLGDPQNCIDWDVRCTQCDPPDKTG